MHKELKFGLITCLLLCGASLPLILLVTFLIIYTQFRDPEIQEKFVLYTIFGTLILFCSELLLGIPIVICCAVKKKKD